MSSWSEMLQSIGVPNLDQIRRWNAGAGEAIGTFGTGMAGTVLGGVRAIPAAIGAGAAAYRQGQPVGPAAAEAGTDALQRTQEALTYVPRSEEGQAAIGAVSKPFELWQRLAEAAGGLSDSPAGQTGIQTAVENADMLVAPLKAAALGGKAALAAAPLVAKIGAKAGTVGKHMPGARYVHRSALEDLPPEVVAQIQQAQVPFDWHVAKVGDGGVSLIESTDFDTADFPTVGRSINLATGKVRPASIDPEIYHHKQTMVRPDYTGFDRARADAISRELMDMKDVDRKRYGRKSFMDAHVVPRMTSIGGKSVVESSPAGLWDAPEQAISSADTSINQGKLPGGFTAAEKMGIIGKGKKVIDIGGGRFDNAVEWAKGKGATVGVFDPFNRSSAHNAKVVEEFAGGKSDVATINNVLNVIAEPANQLKVLRQAEDALKPGGQVVIKIYEGDGKGAAKQTSKGFQQNRKTADYLDLVREVFPDAQVKGGVIVATRAAATPDLKVVSGANDGIMRGVLADSPAADAPFPHLANEYPELGVAVDAFDKKKYERAIAEGKSEQEARDIATYQTRGDSPESVAFEKWRAKIMANMKEKNDWPRYFDPAKRFDADKADFPQQSETVFTSKAKTEKAVESIRKAVQTDEARARLQEAYDAGVKSGGHDRWYQMGQLLKEFIDELGPEAGKKAFKERFSDAMAATTTGNAPSNNLLIAHWNNFMREKGRFIPDAGWSIPAPVGGRRLGKNVEGYAKMREQGGMDPETQPKGHNFSHNYLGHEQISTIDEQMTDLITPGLAAPKKGHYFAYEELVQELAKKNGVSPREFQEVAWGGKKFLVDGYEGKPMIETVNEAIERTHRLTGLSRKEIVRRGLVRSQMPLYGVAGAVGVGAAMQDKKDSVFY